MIILINFSAILAFGIVQVIHAQSQSSGLGPECMRCEGAASVDDCKLTTTICGVDEYCYLEKVTTAQLKAIFNAGCRSKRVCDVMALLGGSGKRDVDDRQKKAEGDLVNCAECCNDPKDDRGPCNSKLCGQKPNATAPACRVCDGVHIDVDSCTKKEACQPTQVCHTGIRIIGTAVRYIFGCEERHVCAELIKNEVSGHSGRAEYGLQICDACCDGDECNAVDCFDLKKNMTLASIGVGSNSQVTTRPVVQSTAQPVTLGPALSVVATAASSTAQPPASSAASTASSG